jgi:hypothetical protein
MAKKDLLSSMTKFQQDMEKCAARANETEAQFDALIKCAGEVKLAMADEMGRNSSHAVLRCPCTYSQVFSYHHGGRGPDETRGNESQGGRADSE